MEQEWLDGQRFALNPLHEKERTPPAPSLPVVPAHLNQRILKPVLADVAASSVVNLIGRGQQGVIASSSVRFTASSVRPVATLSSLCEPSHRLCQASSSTLPGGD